MTDTNALDQGAVGRRQAHWWIALGLFTLALLIRWPFIRLPGFPPDQTQFVMWTQQTLAGGLAAPYAKTADRRAACNYPPAYLYVLRALGTIYNAFAPAGSTLDESVAQAVWRGERTDAARLATSLHKWPAAFADAVMASLLFIWLTRRLGSGIAGLVAGLYALSPAVIHNSSVWGQVDAIPTLLMVASLEAAARRRILWMTAWATLAVLTKPQALILAPAWAATVWTQMQSRARRVWHIAALSAGISILVLVPFMGALDGVWQSYAGAAQRYPYTHLNGFSAWFLGSPLEAPHLGGSLARWYQRDDIPDLAGLAPRTWGMIGVLSIWTHAFLMLVRRRSDAVSLRWVARVLPLGFFVLSTQMHERYLFPAIALWAWGATSTWRWWIGWLLICACAAANAMWVWPGPSDTWWTDTFQRVFAGRWIGATCGALLIVVLVMSLFETHVLEPRRSSPRINPAA